ncbi:MAG: oxygen-independent coproporphyrinogen III oxidase [Bacteroidota bacterium]
MQNQTLKCGHLVRKYNRPVPRYTSYPTVPYWQTTPPNQEAWQAAVHDSMMESAEISLYIHLPFCEQLCTYCGCNKHITKNHRLEGPYIDSLLKEWGIYLSRFPAKPKIKELHLGGGTPTFFQPQELRRLLKGIFAKAERAEVYAYSFEAHPSSTVEEHLACLADFGFDRVSIGIQDFSQAILQLINRKQTFEEVVQTVDLARKHNYRSINFDIIYGLPAQTKEDILNTVDHISNFLPERIAFYSYAHVPWISKSQRAYSETDLPTADAKRALHDLGQELLLDIGYKAVGMDHFALPQDDLYLANSNQSLHRNFMGYTPMHTQLAIALGCSAISDSWDTYIQNEKTVKGYQKALLEEERLPIYRGHQLSNEDQLVRRHIHNLMCKQATNWKNNELRCLAIDRAVPFWDDMAADGLLIRKPYEVKVTEKGVPFLRNICLPLDDYYWANQPNRPTFSQAV